MKKVHYSILIPDEVEVVSIEIILKPKASRNDGHSQTSHSQQWISPLKRHEATDEPDEGLLFDELY
jgi:hypothetical protein